MLVEIQEDCIHACISNRACGCCWALGMLLMPTAVTHCYGGKLISLAKHEVHLLLAIFLLFGAEDEESRCASAERKI